MFTLIGTGTPPLKETLGMNLCSGSDPVELILIAAACALIGGPAVPSAKTELDMVTAAPKTTKAGPKAGFQP